MQCAPEKAARVNVLFVGWYSRPPSAGREGRRGGGAGGG